MFIEWFLITLFLSGLRRWLSIACILSPKGLKIDVDWLANVARYERDMDSLSSMYDSLCRTDLEYPNYYLQPFHAYEDGNLSWKAAMEVESAALIVHAALYTENRAVLDRTGDFLLRDRFHQNMINLISQADLKPQRVVDLGCSTGLSTMKLHESFPHADVFGIDLSPYMLAGKHAVNVSLY